MKENKGAFLWKIIQAGIIILTVIGFVKSIFISLDIDESYAVAQAYRLACGDKMFVDMWESHQLSAFLAALFIKPYVALFHTTNYLVIYLRIVGILIHTGLGIWLYRSVKEEYGKVMSFLALFLHLNFLPKWVQMPEFEVMHYWFLLAAFLFLQGYFTGEKKSWWRPALAGACLVGSMMSYPTMILAYPVYLIGLCVLEKQKKGAVGYKMLRSSLWFTAGAGATGISFLLYLFSYQSVEDFMRNISYIFMDVSHTTYTTAEKWQRYGEQAAVLLEDYFGSLWIAVILAALIFLLAAILQKKPLKQFFSSHIVESVILVSLMSTAFLLQWEQIRGCLLEDKNQFYFQIRYFAVILPAIYLGIRYHKKLSVPFYLCVLPALVSVPAVLAITNMDVNVTLSRVFLGVLGSLLMWAKYLQESEALEAKIEKAAMYVVSLGLLAGFFLCRLILIRVTGCLPVTINANLDRMEAGPEKGIYVLQDYALVWNDNYKVLQELVNEDSKLLYIGAENLIYPAVDCTVASPSTQGTTVFNEMFLRYYEENPERIPDTVIMDYTYQLSESYGYGASNQQVLDWVEEHFADATVYETPYMKILFRKD